MRSAIPLGGLLGLLLGLAACTAPREPDRLAYSPLELRADLERRLPGIADAGFRAPFEVGGEDVERARKVIESQPYGLPRIRALVDMLSAPPPGGFGLIYDWSTTRTASETLSLGEGNCLSFASVLVGLGRGLDWPIYFAEARAVKPTLHVEDDLAWSSEHMVVVITARTVRAVVDFSGPVKDYRIHVIGDVRAYAHLLNNRASEEILKSRMAGSSPQWTQALEDFGLAARIDPGLRAAWNNQGVALARLGRFEEARVAYLKASEFAGRSDSPARNLQVLETRSRGEVSISGEDLEAPDTR